MTTLQHLTRPFRAVCVGDSLTCTTVVAQIREIFGLFDTITIVTDQYENYAQIVGPGIGFIRPADYEQFRDHIEYTNFESETKLDHLVVWVEAPLDPVHIIKARRDRISVAALVWNYFDLKTVVRMASIVALLRKPTSHESRLMSGRCVTPVCMYNQ